MASVLSTKRWSAASTTGEVKSSQKRSFSAASSAAGWGLVKRLAFAAVIASNRQACSATRRATVNASPRATTWLTRPICCARVALRLRPRQQEVSDDRVAHVAPQSGDASPAWDEPESKLREAEARGLVGDQDVAGQRELKAPAEHRAVQGADGGQWGLVDGVIDSVYAVQERAHLAARVGHRAAVGLVGDELAVELFEIGTGAEPAPLIRVNHHRLSAVGAVAQVGREGLELAQGRQPDLVGRRAVERDLEDVTRPGPRQGVTFKERLARMHWRLSWHTGPLSPPRSAPRSPCGGASDWR
jgi:hypothetical protein